MIAAGDPAPEFTLKRGDGSDFTRAELDGQTTVLVFYPFAFSPVCTDQFNLYEEVLDEFKARGATLYGVSCDAGWSQTAFQEKLGVTIEPTVIGGVKAYVLSPRVIPAVNQNRLLIHVHGGGYIFFPGESGTGEAAPATASWASRRSPATFSDCIMVVRRSASTVSSPASGASFCNSSTA